MKKSGIYKLTFPNGKVYVGLSIDIKQRWYAHKCTLNKTRTPLINAINKYGWNNVIKDVLWFTEDETNVYDIMNLLETDFISLHNSLVPNGYNVRLGGENEACPDLVKLKISESLKGFKHTEEAKKNMSESRKGLLAGEKNPMYGKKYTDEERKKLSESHKGKGLKSISLIKDGEILNFNSVKEAAEYLKCKPCNFSDLKAGRQKSVKGYLIYKTECR